MRGDEYLIDKGALLNFIKNILLFEKLLIYKNITEIRMFLSDE